MKKPTYEIGDKVRIAPYEVCKEWSCFRDAMKKYCGTVMTIREPNFRHVNEYYMVEDKGDTTCNYLPGWSWHIDCIEGKVDENMFDRNDLRTGDILVYRTDFGGHTRYEMIALGVGSEKWDIRVPVNAKWERYSGFNWVCDISKDMTTPSGVILKVLRPDYPRDFMSTITTGYYNVIWERDKSAPKKMTVAEICDKLGYDVEVVRG